MKYGIPLKVYPDQHSIFRYVKDRDKHNPWNIFTKFTDDVDPQWKQVMLDCKSSVTYALSPQAKGKVERPYQWMQDHIVRTCVREGVDNIEDGRQILKKEVSDYNSKRILQLLKKYPISDLRTQSEMAKRFFENLNWSRYLILLKIFFVYGLQEQLILTGKFLSRVLILRFREYRLNMTLN